MSTPKCIFVNVFLVSRHGRNSTNASTFSKLSQMSLDSVGDDVNDNNVISGVDQLLDNAQDGDSVETVRTRAQSKTALQVHKGLSFT
jgi:hypothetical protein